MIDKNFKKVEKGRKEEEDCQKPSDNYAANTQHSLYSTEYPQDLASSRRQISNSNLYKRSCSDRNIPKVIKAVKVARHPNIDVPEKVISGKDAMDDVAHLKFDRGGIKMNDEDLYDGRCNEKMKTSSEHDATLTLNGNNFKLIDDAKLFLGFIKKIHSSFTNNSFKENQATEYKSNSHGESPELDSSSITCLKVSPAHSYEYLKRMSFPSSLAQAASHCSSICPKKDQASGSAKSLSKAVVKLKNFSTEGIKEDIADSGDIRLHESEAVRSKPPMQESNDSLEVERMDETSKKHFDSPAYGYCKNECEFNYKKQDDSASSLNRNPQHSYLFNRKNSRPESPTMERSKLNELLMKTCNVGQSAALEQAEGKDVVGTAIEQAKRKCRGGKECNRICGDAFEHFNEKCKIITAKRPSRNIKD